MTRALVQVNPQQLKIVPPPQIKQYLGRAVNALATGLNVGRVATSGGVLAVDYGKVFSRLLNEALLAYALYQGNNWRANALRIQTRQGGQSIPMMIHSKTIFAAVKQIVDTKYEALSKLYKTGQLCLFAGEGLRQPWVVNKGPSRVNAAYCLTGSLKLIQAARLSTMLLSTVFSLSDIKSTGKNYIKGVQGVIRVVQAYQAGRRKNAAKKAIYSTILLLYTVFNTLMLAIFILGNPEYNKNIPTTTAYEQAQFYFAIKHILSFVIKQYKTKQNMHKLKQVVAGTPLRIAAGSGSPGGTQRLAARTASGSGSPRIRTASGSGSPGTRTRSVRLCGHCRKPGHDRRTCPLLK